MNIDNIIGKIVKLYDLHKNSDKTILKMKDYIEKDLPILLKKYSDDEKRKLFLEKESNKYVNDFLTNPNYQYFYIGQTDIFVKYNGEDYGLINEDKLWMKILTDITNKEILLEYKQKIKDVIIQKIKKKSLFNTIPESCTVQNIINFFTSTIFETKEDVKYFLACLGDNILNKKLDLHYFVTIESKLFFDTIESLCVYYFGNKLNVNSTIRYRYRGENYNKSRILYFTTAVKNKSCWFSFLKDNLFNLIVLCCHYSTRYVNAEKYVLQRNQIFKNKIFYLKNNSKQELVNIFVSEMCNSSENSSVSMSDMFYLWKLYLKSKKIPNIMFKSEFEELLKNNTKINFENNNIKNIESNYLINIKNFKRFWNNNIKFDEGEEIEVSELHTLLIKWLKDNNKQSLNFTEENVKDIISYFYKNIIIKDFKFLQNISCKLWDKKKDIMDAFKSKFNKNIKKSISIYDSYVLYCKYASNKGNVLTVSKKYYFNFVNKNISKNFIVNGEILPNCWDNL